ncbi:MAG: hypothetical protein PHE83_11170 [Opitutaceae bacterium]|nr:hypothetical protein [Opitutaceae bacterium]
MHPQQPQRGSVLLTALLLSAIIAISLVSYLQITMNSRKLAQRSFYANAAMNLVDTGVEQALWSLNQGNWTGAGFTAVDATHWQATFPTSSTYFQLMQGVRGQVKVWVDQSNANRPHAVAKAIITLGDGSELVKEAEVYMRKRSYFANGLVAKNSITFSGNNAAVDSWNSDPDNNPGTAAVPYSSGVAHDNGQIGSTSVQVDSISVSNADIYGYAAIGTSDLTGISVGPQGSVGPYGTANGDIDATHVTYDFTTSFPDATAPTTSGYTLPAITGATTLPRAGDLPAADGGYYYSVPSISLSGSGATLSIGGSSANVVIVVTNTTGTTVSTTGHGGIAIATDSSLALYTSGNVAIAGNGVVNGTFTSDNNGNLTSGTPNQPASFAVYGTRSSADAATNGLQDIKIAGNGILSGIVYAPNASLEMKGGGNSGQVLGAAVANTVTVTGNSVFHYDESLADASSSNLWGLSKWRELASAADRNAYTSQLNF